MKDITNFIIVENNMGKAYVKINMSFVVEYDTNLYDENDVIDKSVACFYFEDKAGVENFLPKEEGLEVIDYLDTDGVDVTKQYVEE
jgi:hypothetical protein